jgi:uncharacterized protein YciI
MQFLAILRVRSHVTEEQQAALRRAEVEAVWKLTESGILRSIRFSDTPGAVLEIEAASRDEAAAHIAALPMVEADLLSVDLLALSPFTGFATLFAPQR